MASKNRKVKARFRTVLMSSGFITVEFWWGKRIDQQGFAYVRRDGTISHARLRSQPVFTDDTWVGKAVPSDIAAAVLEAARSVSIESFSLPGSEIAMYRGARAPNAALPV